MEMGAIDTTTLPYPHISLYWHLFHNDVVKQFKGVEKSSSASKATTLLGYQYIQTTHTQKMQWNF
jgi:hypothetical protein